MPQLQLENAVLRHQVKVLRRTVRRPELKDRFKDRLANATGVDLNNPPEIKLPELLSTYEA